MAAIARNALFATLLLSAVCSVGAERRDPPVAALARSVYTIHTPQGNASLPIEFSLDVGKVHPEITRAALVFHGKGRRVDHYYKALEAAAFSAGSEGRQHTLLIAPQFLREED